MNKVMEAVLLPSGVTLQIVHGDITLEQTEAIVNAANAYLQHGAGVAGAIVRRGGEGIQRESDAWVQQHGLVTHDSPAYTSGGKLSAKYVIHAVGPIWGEGDEDAKLAAAVQGSLRLAETLGVTSLSLPAISTGIFGFPQERAAAIILSEIQKFFAKPSGLKLVRLVLFDQLTLNAFCKVWHDHFCAEP